MTDPNYLLLVGADRNGLAPGLESLGYRLVSLYNATQALHWLTDQVAAQWPLPQAVLCDDQLPDGNARSLFEHVQQAGLTAHLKFIVASPGSSVEATTDLLAAGIDAMLLDPITAEKVHERLQQLAHAQPTLAPPPSAYHAALPRTKRLFDMLFALLALLLLLPMLLLIALIIKLESRGPVFYVAKRVGRHYQTFNFYKFRTMRKDADAQRQQLMALNQYQGSFFKLKNDPRVTRFGAFLRNYSLDELPQLLNVLLGDMSLIGNRPLPLYEAESLTTDEYATRFFAPAGITGLWQVTRRGHADMSDHERRQLDNQYAQETSFFLDLKIFLKTFNAIKQKESV
ncbi:Sugar transferase involved in LPS biosynthesis (colanic, teichoic acid) [Catalinimonas alkaloidigena]|uniref:Sugar transferase involved in LPS biosynthesis (Colanic, teichoic acid) n=1 Tax=Catalinimonas alkaloidigena TaxID=1075417 RepID=A0A1G9H2T2_9BACT|nr:sugar transferase [Catalinimonas alkaloidigena]SDL07182.1 Sugar transferase involved in LPS biosynthesis (colanic, teichoic acid) [Catalinimonas alkaloidigena]